MHLLVYILPYNTDSSLDFYIINYDIIHIQMPKWSIVKHFGGNMSEND